MSDEGLQVEAVSAPSHATWGERFLAQYRRAAQGYAWNYEAIQAIKRLEREEFLTLMRQRGSFRYEDFQKARELSPERFADWVAGDWESALSELRPIDGPWGARVVARYRAIKGESFWNAETTKTIETLDVEAFLAWMRRRGGFQYEDFHAARSSTPEEFATRLARQQDEAVQFLLWSAILSSM